MTFFERLQSETKTYQDELFAIPFVKKAIAGEISLDTYVAFLTQAFYHVRHTVPLLMTTGGRLESRYEWLRTATGEYISEEVGHHEWILGDIAACAADAEVVHNGQPELPCELMVAYAYDVAQRRNPIGFFGMVHVLEGTSVRAATQAANRIQVALGLHDEAMTYLTTHGDLDQDHVGFFEKLMNDVTDAADQDWIVHCAKNFFTLYGNMFRALPLTSGQGEE